MKAFSGLQSDAFSQTNYACRLEWGRDGAAAAEARGDLVVIVDALCFSTTVITAVHHGGVIFPCLDLDEKETLAEKHKAVKAVRRDEVPNQGKYSLSPETFQTIEQGARVVLTSPNGSICCRLAAKAPRLLLGAFVNARTMGEVLTKVLDQGDLAVTLVACGERWQNPGEDGELRFAIEDFLAAGAILSYMKHDKSPEARVAESAFAELENQIDEIIWECTSGLELRSSGYGHDVSFAAQLNIFDTIVQLEGEKLVKLK